MALVSLSTTSRPVFVDVGVIRVGVCIIHLTIMWDPA